MPISLNERNIMRETIGKLVGTEPIAAEVLLLLDALDKQDKEIERLTTKITKLRAAHAKCCSQRCSMCGGYSLALADGAHECHCGSQAEETHDISSDAQPTTEDTKGVRGDYRTYLTINLVYWCYCLW